MVLHPQYGKPVCAKCGERIFPADKVSYTTTKNGYVRVAHMKCAGQNSP